MGTVFRSRRTADSRSGGKILRGKRVAASASPYLRPKSPPPRSENPNWLVGLFPPAIRTIANGAGKLVSSVFGSDRPPSPSSGSDSSSDDDGDDNPSDGSEELNLKNGMASEGNKCLQKEPQVILWNSEAKLAIEQLIMQETFTRDEYDRLIKIIQLRVVDCPTNKEGEDTRKNEVPDRTVGSGIGFPGVLQPQWQTRNSPTAYPYMVNSLDSLTPRASELGKNMSGSCNTAVMEARKWLEEKKVESSSKSGMDHGTCNLNAVTQPYVNEGKGNSPVDMAKSYMRARPPWVSPSLSHVGSQTPLPIGLCHFKEEIPYGASGHSLSSSKDLDDIRLTKRKEGNSSVFDDSLVPHSISIQRNDPQGCLPDMINSGPEVTSAEDAKPSLLGDATDFSGLNDAHTSGPLPCSPIGEIVQGKNSSQPHQDSGLKGTYSIDDSRPQDGNHAAQQEANGLGDTANGLPSLPTSLSAGFNTGPTLRPSEEGDPNSIGSSHGKLDTGIHVEETCELLSEVSIEVPIIEETVSIIATRSQKSSSRQHKQSLQSKPLPTSRRSLAVKSSSRVEKQQEKKTGKNSRRGRGMWK